MTKCWPGVVIRSQSQDTAQELLRHTAQISDKANLKLKHIQKYGPGLRLTLLQLKLKQTLLLLT